MKYGNGKSLSSEVYNQVVDDISTLLQGEPFWSSELEKALEGYKKSGEETDSKKKKQLIFEYSDTENDSDTDTTSEYDT